MQRKWFNEKCTLERYYMTCAGYTRCTIKDMYMLCIWYSEIIIIIKKENVRYIQVVLYLRDGKTVRFNRVSAI